MSATLQSPPRQPAAPTPPPRRSRRLVAPIAAVVLVIAAAAVILLLTRAPAAPATTATADAVPAAEPAPAARQDADNATGAARRGRSAKRDADAAGDAAAPGVADEAPIDQLSKKELAALPKELRQRLRERRSQHTGEPPARPERKPRAATATGPVSQRHDPAPRFGPPAEAGPNQLEVRDQQGNASAVRVARLDTDLDHAFVTVHRLTGDGLGTLLGVKPVTAGTAQTLRVKLDTPLDGPAELVVALHHDDFEPGVYEDGKDREVRGQSGRPIFVRITATP